MFDTVPELTPHFVQGLGCAAVLWAVTSAFTLLVRWARTKPEQSLAYQAFSKALSLPGWRVSTDSLGRSGDGECPSYTVSPRGFYVQGADVTDYLSSRERKALRKTADELWEEIHKREMHAHLRNTR